MVQFSAAAVRPDEKSEEFLQVRDLNLFFSDVDPCGHDRRESGSDLPTQKLV